MSYKIILQCNNAIDQERFGRVLQINSYESAIATFKTLVKVTLEEVIDPYMIELWYGEKLRYRVMSFNAE